MRILTERECPRCKKVKRFYYEICGDCTWKETKARMTKSVGHRITVVRNGKFY